MKMIMIEIDIGRMGVTTIEIAGIVEIEEIEKLIMIDMLIGRLIEIVDRKDETIMIIVTDEIEIALAENVLDHQIETMKILKITKTIMKWTVEIDIAKIVKVAVTITAMMMNLILEKKLIIFRVKRNIIKRS